MADFWITLTEAQRIAFRESQIRAKSLCQRQQEITAEGPEVFYLQCVLLKHEPGTPHWDEADDIWFLHGGEKAPGADRWQALRDWLGAITAGLAPGDVLAKMTEMEG